MRSFVDPTTIDPVPASIVIALAKVDQHAGHERFHESRSPKKLERLAKTARVESITASSAIEGIVVERRTAEALLSGRRPPDGRDEQELAGYQMALDDVYRYPVEELTVPRLLGWHRLLLAHLGPSTAGRLKATDNAVVDVLDDGSIRARFEPVSASATPNALVELVERYEASRQSQLNHPIILVAATVLDFLVIHPFDDGNGRVARLLATALTERAGYRVGRYYSVERLIQDRRDEYYRSLKASTDGWHDSEHSIWPWISFFVDIINAAYEGFEQLVTHEIDFDQMRSLVRDWVLLRAPKTFSAQAARNAVPDASPQLVSSVLAALRDDGLLTLSGTGRGARWTRTEDSSH